MSCDLFEEIIILKDYGHEEPFFISLPLIAVEVRSCPNIRPRPEASLQVVLVTHYCHLIKLFERDRSWDFVTLEVDDSRYNGHGFEVVIFERDNLNTTVVESPVCCLFEFRIRPEHGKKDGGAERQSFAGNFETSIIKLHVQVTFGIDDERCWACTGTVNFVGHIRLTIVAVFSLCHSSFDVGLIFGEELGR